MLHLGTIGYGPREFIAMVGISGPASGNCYIEEVVLNSVDFTDDIYANCKFISDDNLASDLAAFVDEQGLTDMKKRTNEIYDLGRSGWLTGDTVSKK